MPFPDLWRVSGGDLRSMVFTQQIREPEAGLAADLLHDQQEMNVPTLQLLGTGQLAIFPPLKEIYSLPNPSLSVLAPPPVPEGFQARLCPGGRAAMCAGRCPTSLPTWQGAGWLLDLDME